MSLFELTITLRPICYKWDPQKQLLLTWPYLKSSLNGYKKSIVVELTGEFNIHYHCLVELPAGNKTHVVPAGTEVQHKNIILNRLREFHKYFGRKTFQMVQYEQSYREYMIKDYHKTSKIIYNPILHDDFKLIDLIKDLKGTLKEA